MGGKSAPTQPALPAAAPSGFPGPVYDLRMPIGMPGQIRDMADQLEAGYGRSFYDQLRSLYAPTDFRAMQNIPGMSGKKSTTGTNAGAATGGLLSKLAQPSSNVDGRPHDSGVLPALPWDQPQFDPRVGYDPATISALEAWLAPFMGLPQVQAAFKDQGK